MRYHDFHLQGYSVSDYGATITLCLIKNAPSQTELEIESHIEFSEVEAYDFVHMGGAILTDILEVSLDQMVGEVYGRLAEWSSRIGPPSWCWKNTASEYLIALKEQGHRAWWVYSAVGFEGFVIAKNVRQTALYERPVATGADPGQALNRS